MACLFNGISDFPGAEFLGATVKFKGRYVVLRPCKKKYDARKVVLLKMWNKTETKSMAPRYLRYRTGGLH